MRINNKVLLAAVMLALTAVTGIFAFCAFQGKYMFAQEPTLDRKQVVLEKVPLSERKRLETELLRDKLPLDAQRRAYDVIKQHTMEADGARFRLADTDRDDIYMALAAFRGDHPEVFWIDPGTSYSYYEEEAAVNMQLHFTESGDALQKDRKALEAAVKKAIAEAPKEANDYDIELFLNDYIAKHCAYDIESEHRHSAYGALVNGGAVCDGYSKAFQLLCKRLGVECTVVEGTSEFNKDEDNGHMWNCVRLGGEWYHTDVTWNDSPNAACEVERYFYLNLTAEEIARDHVISGGYEDRSDNRGNYFNIFVPDCTCEDLNFLRLNCAVIDDPEQDEQILASLIDASRRGQTYCAFLIGEEAPFYTLTKKIADEYAGAWLHGTNRFLDGKPTIAENGSMVTYEDKRVIAFLITYV